MNSRERVLAAVSKKNPDYLPSFCGRIDDIEYWLENFKVGSELEVRKYLGMDCQKMSYSNMFIKEPGKTIFGCEDFYDAGYGSAKHYPLAAAETLADIEKHPWPTIEQVDFDDAAAEIKKLDQNSARIGTVGFQAVFCLLCDLFGMEQAMMNMHTEPKLIEASIEKIESFLYTVIKRMLDEHAKELDFFWYGDDFSTQRGIMISPEMWRKYLKPVYRKIFGLIKSYDLDVWFHSCGTFAPVLGELVEAGMDVWETVQVHLVDNDPESLKRNYGDHITFFGAINCQQTLPFGTPEDVRKEVRERFRVLGKNGGYIAGPDHSVQKNIPWQNVEALYDEAHKCMY